MGACLSKKKETSTTPPFPQTKSLSTPPPQNPNNNNFTATLLKSETTLQQNQQNPEEFQKHQQNPDEFQPKNEIFSIKNRKSHDERDKNSIKITPLSVQHNVPSQKNDGFVSSSETESSISNNNVVVGGGVVGVRISSCTKEELDAILIQCGRLSRSSSGKAASSSAKKYSGSKRSFDFDNNNDSISTEEEQKRVNASDNSEEYDRKNHRQRHRNSPSPKPNGRRRTPSREREQRSSSRERRVSRSPGRRSSENGSNNNNNNGSGSGSGSGCSRPGKLVTVPATVSSVVMDKSNNGGEGVKRVNVKRNVASPRSMSPARGNGNVVNQQQGSLSRNNSARKTEVSPFRRNPLSEVDPNSLAYAQSSGNNGGSKVQNKGKKEIEAEAVQKSNVEMKDNTRNRTSNRSAMEKGVSCNPKEQQEAEIKVMSSISDNAIVKNVVIPSGIIRSRSSRRSRDFDNIINPETLTAHPPQSSYTSLLLKDIHNFHQKNQTTQQQEPSVSLPSCLNKACSILEAVADLNSTTKTSDISYTDKNKKFRNEYNVDSESFVESEVDVMEPSFHKYVTVKRGGSICEDQEESSGSNSFTVSSGQQWNICSSGDSSDCWSSRLNSKDECLKRRECDHQHSGGIGRGRFVATAAAAST